MIKAVFSSHMCQIITLTGDRSCLRSWGRIRGIQKFLKNANIKKNGHIHEGAYAFDLAASCLRVLPETGVPRGCDLRCSAGPMISLP